MPLATMRPWFRIATRSQTSSTSLSRCELSMTATPRSRSPVRRSRTIRRPIGSSALVGSSSISRLGSPTSAWAIPRRCCMPFDIASTRVARASLSSTSSSSSRALAGTAARAGERLVEREQLVGRQPVGEAEQLGEVADRPSRAGRAGGRSLDLGRALGRAHEPAGDLRERRLAGAVRAEQAEQLAALDLEVDAGERDGGAVALGQPVAGEGGRHRAQCRNCVRWV